MDNYEIVKRIKKTDLTRIDNLENLWHMGRVMNDLKLNDEVLKIAKDLTKEYTQKGMMNEVSLFGDLCRKCYIFSAPHNFDHYMIASEWNREYKAKFWIPRRNVLEGQHKVATQIQEFMDDPEMLLLGISAPPGIGKSTLIKFLISYIAGNYPESTNMYISYADGMVRMMYESVTAIMTNPEYAYSDVFPNLGNPDVSAEYFTVSYRPKGDFPTIGLVSLGGSVTGRTRANKYMITDDLVKNKEMARSPERLIKLFDDYNATLTSRMIGDNVKQIILGTIWSIHDPISKIKQKHEGDRRYKFIVLPVCDENGHSNFLYDHPDRYTDEKIRSIKENTDPADFSCLYMQKGIEKEGIAFPADSLLYYNGVLPDGEPDDIYFFCDVAWGGGDNLSMPICYQFGESGYVHDAIYDKRDKLVTKPRVIGKVLQHRVKRGRFEANNGGDEYCDDVSRMLSNEHKYSCNLSHKKAPTTMGKIARIEQHAPVIRKFYYLAEKYRSEEYNRFMNDLTIFSMTGSNVNDDAPDSMAGLSGMAREGVREAQVGERLL